MGYYQQWVTAEGCISGLKKKKKPNRFEDRPYFETELIQCKKKGNRVLNENLDKIKFPFGCTYTCLAGKKLKIFKGMVFKDGSKNPTYILVDITEQDKHRPNVVSVKNELGDLIRRYNINIVKIKTLLFQK
jgi:hypothetical protein